jgi:hypothetical protein
VRPGRQHVRRDQSADYPEGTHDKCCDANAMPVRRSARRSLSRGLQNRGYPLDARIEREALEELILGVDAVGLARDSTHHLEHSSH